MSEGTLYYGWGTASDYPAILVSPWMIKGERLGKPSCKKSAVFLNIVQTAFDPSPSLVLNMYVANFFERFSKKWINACRDKIRQNNAQICGKNVKLALKFRQSQFEKF